MIEFKQGNLLQEQTEALVNTVNCVGIMGKGIALQFKQAFPDNFKAYKQACDRGQVQLGRMFTFSTGKLFNPRYIINFPTKSHWRGKSKIEDITSGLNALVEEVKSLNLKSIAIPPLGCGNGGLEWIDIKPLIIQAFASLPEVKIVLFEPIDITVTSKIAVNTKIPRMTRSRALFIELLEIYGLQGYRLTKLEIQKLAYFLQVAGEPLKLRYQKEQFGPYADNLNHTLLDMQGHYLEGFGDRSSQSSIYVLSEARNKAKNFLESHPDAYERLEKVSNLILGFETPYGLEMLATVHWVVTQEEPKAAENCDLAIEKVQQWSERKRDLFKPSHLCKAWQRLQEQGWFNSNF